MRGAPAANLAIKRLLPQYPELAGIIIVPPLPTETPRPSARAAEGESLRALDEFGAEQRSSRATTPVLGGEGLAFTGADETGAPNLDATPTALDRELERVAEIGNRIVNRAAEGAGREFEGPIGIGGETWLALQKAGFFRSGNDGALSTLRAFNEILIGGGAVAGDLALRSALALESAVGATLGQTARELGETETMARRLERDFLMLAAVVQRGRPGRPRKRNKGISDATPARQKGDRFKVQDDPLQQFEEIENAQRKSRQGKSNQIIQGIGKSKQRDKKALKEKRGNISDIDLDHND